MPAMCRPLIRLRLRRQERGPPEHRRRQQPAARGVVPRQGAQPRLESFSPRLAPATECRGRRELAEDSPALQAEARPLRTGPRVVTPRVRRDRGEVSGQLELGAVGGRRPAHREREPSAEKPVVAVGHPAQAGPAFAVASLLGAFHEHGKLAEGSPEVDRPHRRGAHLMPGRPERHCRQAQRRRPDGLPVELPEPEEESAGPDQEHRPRCRVPSLVHRAAE
jgi:hypothetical protein